MKVYDEQLMQRILEYVGAYQREHGRSPSYRNILHTLHVSTLAKVQRYVKVLTDRGLIQKDEIGTIQIPTNLQKSKTILAPIVGQVACGTPILANENIEDNVALPTSIFGDGETYILKAKGNSMIDAGIEPGDLLVVKKDTDFTNGDMVIALIGNEATAKRIYVEDNKVILHPENKRMKDIIVDDINELQIRGRVVNIIKDVVRCKRR